MNAFWTSSLADTVETSTGSITRPAQKNRVSSWLKSYSEDHPTSSNQGAFDVPFQRWFHFKEAFSPKFVADTLNSMEYEVRRCIDPFGGSGTTAITCRMLGVRSVSNEVNPFLADIIQSKLAPVDPIKFEAGYSSMRRNLRVSKGDRALPSEFPPTMTEPGVKGRYIFPLDVFGTARAILRRLTSMPECEARLLRVLLGSVLIQNSNVRINGKGRRYRSNWETREKTREDLLADLDLAVREAVEDLTAYAGLAKGDNRVIVGDCRSTLSKVQSADIAIFSPPYPNSFDYTDVYNVELWMLGYLSASKHNTELRQSTLRSHVQTRWADKTCDSFLSPELDRTVADLVSRREQLWDRNIPNMVRMYFEDLFRVFVHLNRILPQSHHAVVAIGDSQYAGVLIDVSSILSEVVEAAGFTMSSTAAIRSMRASSQHGGGFELSEHCLVFEKVRDLPRSAGK